MEITIILARDVPYGAVYHANFDELNTRFDIIIERFSQIIKKNLSIKFNKEDYRYFILDTNNPFSAPSYTEITDLDMELKMVHYSSFDLYISQDEPQFECPTELAVNSTTKLTEEETLESLIHEGMIQMEAKDFSKAIKAFQEAHDNFPDDPRPVQCIIEILLLLHRYKNALSLISSHLHMFPTNVKLQYLNAKAHYKNGLYKQCLDLVRSIQLAKDERDIVEINVLHIKTLLKLNCIAEADSMIALLKKDSETNIKLVKLVAKVYLTRGNLLEAVRVMLASCVYNPNYEDLQKFIGKYIINYKSSAILFNEMFDCFKDPAQMFFLAKTFYDYGRCDQANSCFIQAFMMQTKSAAMTLMIIKNSIAMILPPSKILEMTNIFLYASIPLASFLYGQECGSINHLVKPPLKSDFNQANEKKKAEQLVPFKSGTIESSLSTAQLETIEIIMTLQIYLFINGYITQAQNIVPKKVFDIAITKTIISETARASIILNAFLPTIPRPLPILKPIYLFGYETIIPISYHTINFRGQQMILQPVMIQGLSYTTLAKRKNPAYFEFARRMNLVPEYSTVIFDFGRADCKDAIIESTKLIFCSTKMEALMNPINNLVKGIKKLRKKRKIRILVHPVMMTNNRAHLQVIEFNNLLKEAINELEKTINEVQFIDIVDQCLNGENKQLKDELYFNKVAWNSNYLPIMEEYLNINLPKNPFPKNIQPADSIDPDLE